MELQLIGVGRNKVNKTVTIKQASDVLKEIKKYIMSQEIDLTPVEDKINTYDIYVGTFRKVGQIVIKK